MNIYGRSTEKGEPELVLWEGSINPDGTAGEDHREMAIPLSEAEETVRLMKEKRKE